MKVWLAFFGDDRLVPDPIEIIYQKVKRTSASMTPAQLLNTKPKMFSLIYRSRWFVITEQRYFTILSAFTRQKCDYMVNLPMTSFKRHKDNCLPSAGWFLYKYKLFPQFYAPHVSLTMAIDRVDNYKATSIIMPVDHTWQALQNEQKITEN